MKILLFFFTSSILFGCSLQEDTFTVLKYKHKKIYFPENLPIINNETSQITNDIFGSNNLKIITFINGNCSVCIEHLTYQNKFYLYDVDPITILISQDLESFYEINKYLKFNYAIIYDKDDIIRKNNSIHDSHLTKYLLLDSNNKVLLIGDPIINPKVKDVYFEVIKNHKKI